MPHSTFAKRRAYYKRRRKYFNKKSLEYYHAHKRRMKKQRKKWRDTPKNKKKLLREKRKYYRKHRAKFLRWHKKYYKKHRRRIRERTASPTIRYSNFRTSSKRRKLVCNIKLETYVKLISKPCFYCGGKLERFGIGLDRINSLKGYIVGNVVPCCPMCNTIKWDLTVKELLIHIKLIYKRFKKGYFKKYL